MQARYQAALRPTKLLHLLVYFAIVATSTRRMISSFARGFGLRPFTIYPLRAGSRNMLGFVEEKREYAELIELEVNGKDPRPYLGHVLLTVLRDELGLTAQVWLRRRQCGACTSD